MAHQVLSTDEWPLFEFRATRVDERTIRFHFSLDLLIADAWSAQIIFDDFRRFMEQPYREPPALELSFRDYLLADEALAGSKPVDESKQYWWSRLDHLPPGPNLPLARDPGSLDKPRFHRRVFRIEPARWTHLKHRAADMGLTPSGLLLAAFGQVLARFSRDPRLTLNVTTFRRLPLHSEVNAIVGDFTSLTLLEIDMTRGDNFEERARAVQDRLWQDLDHRYISGIEVLREWSKRQGRAPGALLPVVFTSLLTRYEGEPEDREGEGPAMDEVFALSQTPQVWLDHQVVEELGGLVLNWDCVDDLFYPGFLDAMFGAYRHLLDALGRDDSLWRTGELDLLPAEQVEARAAANDTAAPVSEETLFSLFLQGAEQYENRAAVLSAERTLTYGELLRHTAASPPGYSSARRCPRGLWPWSWRRAGSRCPPCSASTVPLPPIYPSTRPGLPNGATGL